MAEFLSKHAVVSRAPYILYMSFVDMRNFLQMLPADKKEGVKADYDTISATVQGFNIGVKVADRIPYSRITYEDDGAPFRFTVNLHFDASGGDPDKTDFHINVDADLNFMMKMVLGNKIQEGLDKIVEGIAAASEGKMPEGFEFPEGFNPHGGNPNDGTWTA